MYWRPVKFFICETVPSGWKPEVKTYAFVSWDFYWKGIRTSRMRIRGKIVMVAIVVLHSNWRILSEVLHKYWRGYRQILGMKILTISKAQFCLKEASVKLIVVDCQVWRSFNSFWLLSSSISHDPKYLIMKKVSLIHGMAVSGIFLYFKNS